ncbi:MAG: hypothetical protein SFT68_05475 [Rickettsiaceae bacterium]|nr:hypothetical protein [Rickettsiaceae bacterium]
MRLQKPKENQVLIEPFLSMHNPPLHLAIRNSNTAVAMALIGAGAAINQQDRPDFDPPCLGSLML